MEQEIYRYLIDVLVALVYLLVAGLLHAGYSYVRVRVGSEKRAALDEIARIVFNAVEQVAIRKGWKGAAKMRQALIWADELARQHGISASEQEMEHRLEGIVLQTNSWQKSEPGSPPAPNAANGK